MSKTIQSIAKNNEWQVVGPKRRNRNLKSSTELSKTTKTTTPSPQNKTNTFTAQLFDARDAVNILPIEGEGQGVTDHDVIVYKAARVCESPEDGINWNRKKVVVVLRIPR